jgi:hypothetical protein
MPFARTFEYLGFVLSILIAISVVEVMRPYLTLKVVTAIAVSLQLLLLFNFAFNINKDEAYAIDAKHDIKCLTAGNRFYCFSDLFDTYLKFYKEKNADFAIQYTIRNGEGNINLDTLQGTNFDYLVVDRSADVTQKRKPLLKNEYYTIYGGKDPDDKGLFH